MEIRTEKLTWYENWVIFQRKKIEGILGKNYPWSRILKLKHEKDFVTLFHFILKIMKKVLFWLSYWGNNEYNTTSGLSKVSTDWKNDECTKSSPIIDVCVKTKLKKSLGLIASSQIAFNIFVEK